jgi:lambda family phage portal protein
MKIFDRFKPKVEHIHHHHHDDDRRKSRSGTKYGKISYNENFAFDDSSQRRDISRKVCRESLTAGGVKRRLKDNVINTGMTFESTPLWDMINDKPTDLEERRTWTVDLENRLKLYANSTESDIEDEKTFGKLQRLIFGLGFEEGECFGIIRYLSDPTRISNVALQIINNDQVSTPNDQLTNTKIKDGIEYNAAGQKIAIYIQPSFGEKHVRIPFFSPSGRRFVIHYKANDAPGESRGIPEPASVSYELSRLTEVEINEIEKMASASMWLGAVETEKGANNKKINFQAMDDSNSKDTNNGTTQGIQQVDVGDKAIIMNTLGEGQKFNLYKSDYTNTNLEKLIETYETRICAKFGVSLAFYKNKHDSNYTAARAGILFTWNNVLTRRDDIISGFLNPFIEAVISEWVKDGTIKAPGFDSSKVVRKAWLYGVWNGINRPTVDPVKEAKSSEMRRLLGDTTGEREAKSYNGSDFRENLEKLKSENVLLAEVNTPLDPKQFIDVNKTESKSLNVTEEGENIDTDMTDNGEENE